MEAGTEFWFVETSVYAIESILSADGDELFTDYPISGFYYYDSYVAIYYTGRLELVEFLELLGLFLSTLMICNENP